MVEQFEYAQANLGKAAIVFGGGVMVDIAA